MKKYIIIAGVNGAGKSTLYETLDELKDMPRIKIVIWRHFMIILKNFGVLQFFVMVRWLDYRRTCLNG